MSFKMQNMKMHINVNLQSCKSFLKLIVNMYIIKGTENKCLSQSASVPVNNTVGRI